MILLPAVSYMEDIIDTALILRCMKDTLDAAHRDCDLPIGKQENEKVLYPYFNIRLLEEVRNLIPIARVRRIGSGTLSKEGKEEVDCLLVFESGYKVGIEIKGPTTLNTLLSGTAKSESKSRKLEDLRSCLKEIYNEGSGKGKQVIELDSKIGDIIKLSELVRNQICKGYSIGLLKNVAKESCIYAKKYGSKLEKMLERIKDYVEAEVNFPPVCQYLEDLRILISVVEIKRKPKAVLY